MAKKRSKALSERQRQLLPPAAFVFPRKRAYPLGRPKKGGGWTPQISNARSALGFATLNYRADRMSAADRNKVFAAVWKHFPEARKWPSLAEWRARMKRVRGGSALEVSSPGGRRMRKVANPSGRKRSNSGAADKYRADWMRYLSLSAEKRRTRKPPPPMQTGYRRYAGLSYSQMKAIAESLGVRWEGSPGKFDNPSGRKRNNHTWMGTAHFIDRDAAIAYYRPYETGPWGQKRTEERVDTYLAEGTIHLGRPPAGKYGASRFKVHPKEGRYYALVGHSDSSAKRHNPSPRRDPKTGRFVSAKKSPRHQADFGEISFEELDLMTAGPLHPKRKNAAGQKQFTWRPGVRERNFKVWTSPDGDWTIGVEVPYGRRAETTPLGWYLRTSERGVNQVAPGEPHADIYGIKHPAYFQVPDVVYPVRGRKRARVTYRYPPPPVVQKAFLGIIKRVAGEGDGSPLVSLGWTQGLPVRPLSAEGKEGVLSRRSYEAYVNALLARANPKRVPHGDLEEHSWPPLILPGALDAALTGRPLARGKSAKKRKNAPKKRKSPASHRDPKTGQFVSQRKSAKKRRNPSKKGLQIGRKPSRPLRGRSALGYHYKLRERYGDNTVTYYDALIEAVTDGWVSGVSIVGPGYRNPKKAAVKWIERQRTSPRKNPGHARKNALAEGKSIIEQRDPQPGRKSINASGRTVKFTSEDSQRFTDEVVSLLEKKRLLPRVFQNASAKLKATHGFGDGNPSHARYALIFDPRLRVVIQIYPDEGRGADVRWSVRREVRKNTWGDQSGVEDLTSPEALVRIIHKAMEKVLLSVPIGDEIWKKRKNPPKKRLTKKEFAKNFRLNIMPRIFEIEKRGGGPYSQDSALRYMTWNDEVDAGVKSGDLGYSARNWTTPRWLDTAKPRARRRS